MSSFDEKNLVNNTLARWLKNAKKTRSEKEDEATEKLIRDIPKAKPPRKDLHENKVKVEEDETSKQRVESDPDLSLNYKKVGLRVAKAKKFKSEEKAKGYFEKVYKKKSPKTRKTWKDFLEKDSPAESDSEKSLFDTLEEDKASKDKYDQEESEVEVPKSSGDEEGDSLFDTLEEDKASKDPEGSSGSDEGVSEMLQDEEDDSLAEGAGSEDPVDAKDPQPGGYKEDDMPEEGSNLFADEGEDKTPEGDSGDEDAETPGGDSDSGESSNLFADEGDDSGEPSGEGKAPEEQEEELTDEESESETPEEKSEDIAVDAEEEAEGEAPTSEDDSAEGAEDEVPEDDEGSFDSVMESLRTKELQDILDEPNPKVQSKMLKKFKSTYPDAEKDEVFGATMKDIRADISKKRSRDRFRKSVKHLTEGGKAPESIKNFVDNIEDMLGKELVPTIKKFNKRIKELNSDKNVSRGVDLDTGFSAVNRNQALEGLDESKWEMALKDPKKNADIIADLMAKADFARNQVFNPLNVGGVPLEDVVMKLTLDDRTLRNRTMQSVNHFSNFKPEDLEDASEELHEKLNESENESEKKNLNAMIDGLAVASIKSGESWPLPEEKKPPRFIGQILKFLGGVGFSDYELLQSYKEPTSPNTRLRMYDAMHRATPQDIVELTKGDSSLSSYAEVLVDPAVDPSLKPFIKDTIIDASLDDAMVWDYAVRDFLKSNKDSDISAKDIAKKSEELTSKMSGESPSVEQLIEMASSGDDLETMKNKVRLIRMNSMKETLEDAGADLSKSSPGIALRDAVQEKNPSIVQIKQIPSFDQRLSSETFDQSSFYKLKINSVMPKKQYPNRVCRRNSMKKLSKKGAENLVLTIEKVATTLQENWEVLGLDKEAALDLAFRLDTVCDTVDRVAGCEYGRTTDIPLSALKNEGEVGGPHAGDFDPGKVSETKPEGALRFDADEPYMKGNFTQQETSELAYRQEHNDLENTKCASSFEDRFARDILSKIAEKIEETLEEMEDEKEASEGKEEESAEKKASNDPFGLFA